MTEPRWWRTTRWGVLFYNNDKRDRPMLLGAAWDTGAMLAGNRYAGEPLRPLLFVTRADARAWCSNQHNKYLGRNDCCARWRFRPVRVTESVTRHEKAV